MTRLYVVATPIGNLGDVTLRALEVLREVKIIFCENPRHAKKLLAHYGIPAPILLKYTEHDREKAGELAARVRESGGDAALITDAGTPGISDPGGSLVREARARGIKVIAVPGPSALTAALSVSGIDFNEFTFVGFLPKKRGALRNLLEKLSAERRIAASYESPHRIKKTLSFLSAEFPDISVFIAKELTKVHEDTKWGKPSELLEWVSTGKRGLGEFVIIFDFSGRNS